MAEHEDEEGDGDNEFPDRPDTQLPMPREP